MGPLVLSILSRFGWDTRRDVQSKRLPSVECELSEEVATIAARGRSGRGEKGGLPSDFRSPKYFVPNERQSRKPVAVPFFRADGLSPRTDNITTLSIDNTGRG